MTLAEGAAVGTVVTGTTGAMTADALTQGVNYVNGTQDTFNGYRTINAGLIGLGASLPAIVAYDATLPMVTTVSYKSAFNMIGSALNLGEVAETSLASLYIGTSITVADQALVNSEIGFSERGAITKSFGASGGFVLYPGKANLNMMNRVYSK